MALSAPTRPVLAISVVLAALAVLGKFIPIPIVSLHPIWVLAAGYVVLLIGNLYKGL